VLLRVNEQRNILHEIRKRKVNWIGHILRRNCLLKQVIERKIKGEMKVARRRGRRRKKLLDDLKDRRGHSHLKEVANLFANHLAEVYTPHDDTPDPEILRKLANHAQQTEKPRAFTTGELKGVIKRLHPRKAPGSDLVTPLMLQELPPEGIKAILHLFNAITRLEHWPKPLKQAKVVMILKPGEKPNRCNVLQAYQPLTGYI